MQPSEQQQQQLARAVAGLSAPRNAARLQNHASFFASDALKSEQARIDAEFVEDFVKVLQNQCIYLKSLVCSNAHDDAIFKGICRDMENATGENAATQAAKEQQQPQATASSKAVTVQTAQTKQEQEQEQLRVGFRAWSKHQLFENPDAISPTFKAVVQFLGSFFDVDVYASRLNVYPDGTSWKPFHHDSHAYGGRKEREDFTAGISLGATRDLAFLHQPANSNGGGGGRSAAGREFRIPQQNGDCFAFTNTVNERFMHGVPRATNSSQNGLRLSIIIWGRRTKLTERNGGATSIPANLISSSSSRLPQRNMDGSLTAAGQTNVIDAAKSLVALEKENSSNNGDEQQARAAAAAAGPAKKKKNRLQ